MDALLHRGYDDFRAFVNPLVSMRATLSSEPYLLERVEQGRLIDADGKHYTDLLAGWGTQAFGHRPPAIEAALMAFLNGSAPSFYPSGISPYAGLLASRLHQQTGYDAAFFASGGTEAVEAALKLVRGATGRPRIACIQGAYHGCTFGSVAMMQAGPYRDIFGPHLPMIDALPFGDMDALEKALADPSLAAIVLEPIQVEAGVRLPDAAWLARLCHGTGERGVLLVADEIQTGLGRTGRFLSSEDWPRRPDVVTLGKALGGGLMPLSVMLTRRAIFDGVYGKFALAEAHASTFSGNALACVAGLAALDLLDDAMLAEVRRKGRLLRDALDEWVAPSPLVKAIRGEGLMLGIELDAPDHPCYQFDYLGVPELASQPAIGMLLVHRLYKAGYITQICGHAWQVLRVQPSFAISDDELLACVHALRDALDFLWDLQ
ncbi:aminotransferase class III-fold pyridoxal phosphate-dependent enzyme [Massilia sp. CCM 8695]|uniref:Aminotransferase class III-fold pyridoxal phosphate-dependent enzyme n=1 Tax=Massilia frigida TaxID=2609281 RepID=A0ABX0N3N8_9BURK|nr:aspartate aminotransferase family protein [Massilia frigida]NHZ79662.1 aminotransferase class III-fold pyridoxal phosphate-dependent enzyme [Massilia frigida]